MCGEINVQRGFIIGEFGCMREVKIHQHYYFLLRFYLLIVFKDCFSVKRKIKLVKNKVTRRDFL